MALLLVTGPPPSQAPDRGPGRYRGVGAACDELPGFRWGTDSLPVTAPGSAPYSMPYLGGAYGGYIGMTGNWAYWLGCAQEHLHRLLDHRQRPGARQLTPTTPASAGAYWFMGGPGRGPRLQRDRR